MKTKTIKVCDAIHVDISCEENDNTDIRCGGPGTLGFDFYVSPDEDKKELKKFLIDRFPTLHETWHSIMLRLSFHLVQLLFAWP